jgi:GNAT superfamily N-acetyltransferase
MDSGPKFTLPEVVSGIEDAELQSLAEAFQQEATFYPIAQTVFQRLRRAGIRYETEGADSVKSDLEASIQRGDLLAIKDREGHIMSLMRLKIMDEVGDNDAGVEGPVGKIGRGYTVPEARGQRLYPQLREAMIQHAWEKHPEIKALLTVTKNPIVKGRNVKSGWREVGIEDYFKIAGKDAAWLKKNIGVWKKDGWTAYVLDREK